MPGPADTSYAAHIRRLRGKAIAVGVAKGITLENSQGFEALNALKMGHLTYTRETPTGPVTEPGCGCGTLLICTGELVYITINSYSDREFIVPQNGILYGSVYTDPPGSDYATYLQGGTTYMVPPPGEEDEPVQYPYTFSYAFNCYPVPTVIFDGCGSSVGGNVELLAGPVQIIVPNGQTWELTVLFPGAGQAGVQGTGPQFLPNVYVNIGATTFTATLTCL